MNPKFLTSTNTKPVVANQTSKISRPSSIPCHPFKKKKKTNPKPKYRDQAHSENIIFKLLLLNLMMTAHKMTKTGNRHVILRQERECSWRMLRCRMVYFDHASATKRAAFLPGYRKCWVFLYFWLKWFTINWLCLTNPLGSSLIRWIHFAQTKDTADLTLEFM